MIDPDDIFYLQQAGIVGQDVEAFLQTDVGKRVMERSREVSAAAMNKLKITDPELVSEIRSLQNIIHISTMAVGWLIEAIQDGKVAISNLEVLQEESESA